MLNERVNERVKTVLARIDDEEGEEEKPLASRIKLSPSQIVGSSLAASCSALVASYLGVGGTIGGAALGSVVATTGAAVYSPALRHGSKKIVRKLGPNTFLVSETAPRDSASQTSTSQESTSQDSTPQDSPWTQTEIPITPPAKPEAEAAADTGTAGTGAKAATTAASPPPRKPAYRRPVTLAAAMLAVFGAAITVGLLAGAPIRQAGTGYNLTRPQTATRQQSATPYSGPAVPSAEASVPSASPSAIPSGTAPSSAFATTSQGVASQGASN